LSRKALVAFPILSGSAAAGLVQIARANIDPKLV